MAPERGNRVLASAMNLLRQPCMEASRDPCIPAELTTVLCSLGDGTATGQESGWAMAMQGRVTSSPADIVLRPGRTIPREVGDAIQSSMVSVLVCCSGVKA